MVKGAALKGALAAMPRGGRVTSLPVGAPPKGVMAGVAQGLAQGAGLKRLSPGVYRNPQGQLVNSKGGSLPNQQPQRPQQMPNRFNDISSILGGAAGQQPQNPYLRFDQQPQWRQPAPYQPGQGNMMWMGGSPNFNELTGQYNPPNGFGGGFGAGPNPATDTGFYDYMKQRAIGAPGVSPEQQAAMAPKANYGEQLTPEQQAFNQQQAAGNSLTRILPNGQMVY